jgi:hypothetical protein
MMAVLTFREVLACHLLNGPNGLDMQKTLSHLERLLLMILNG